MKTSIAMALIASVAALGCNSCNGNAPDPNTASATTSATSEPAASTTVRPEANGPEAQRSFYPLFAKGGHPGAAMARAQFSADLRGLPETSKHPGKRPWARDDVLDLLDEMVKKAPAGLKALGEFAKTRPASFEMDFSDPASAVGGGPDAGTAAFNHGAMNLMIGKVRELGEAAKTNEDIVAIYTDIATTPLPVYSSSGGPTDGREQRDVLAKELRHAVGTKRWADTEAARSKVEYRSNK